ncbi:GNAT family N-acetyltransferase [Krasilnikovia sp. MM14-A1259]|uniref:GNAT family N-acetyltransferase n=1 Tax=Krasilnikovia sp. MM14-A1259 TaxID=3373539 RepID=UPI0037FE36AB
MHPEPRTQWHAAAFRDLDAATLYAILRLRADVFVVEQKCAYGDLDGRDTEPQARHVWLADGDDIRAYLRILDDGEAARIGRVVVAPAARGTGVAGELMTQALTAIGDRTVVLEAQAHLVGFYAKFGFQQIGPEYLEDGIPHIPMRRER